MRSVVAGEMTKLGPVQVDIVDVEWAAGIRRRGEVG